MTTFAEQICGEGAGVSGRAEGETARTTDLERIELRGDDALDDVELRHPLLGRPRRGTRELVRVDVRVSILKQIAPAKAEDEEDGLRDGVEDRVLCGTADGARGIERVEPRAEEEAEDGNDAARARAVDELRARHKRGDVARGGRARHRRLVLLEQRPGDEHTLEEIRELGVEGRVPEDNKLRVARLEGAENSAVEDCEKSVELCAPECLAFLDRCG